MKKLIKKVAVCLLSTIGISFLIWIILLLNPSLSYANKTQFDIVTIFHNQDLDNGTEFLIKDVIEIIKSSDLYDEKINILLCLHDDKIYSNLFPIHGDPIAYALLNKTIIKKGKMKVDENIIEVQQKPGIEPQPHKYSSNWEFDYDLLRNLPSNTHPNKYNQALKYNLTCVLAHEFTHNLQFNTHSSYVFKTTIPGKINWKLEGHAEYFGRKYQNDGKLIEKIEQYLMAENKKRNAFVSFELDDGTWQCLPYFKYALITQYLIEIKKMNFNQICNLDADPNEIFSEIIAWSTTKKKMGTE